MALFAETLARLRLGDPQAVEEFVTRYEPFIRRSIRRQLSRTSLHVVADSADVCQSALGSFLIRCGAGEFELDSPQAMEKLIFTIARRKLAALTRRELAECRDRRRTVAWGIGDDPQTDEDCDPQWQVLTADILERIEGRLPPAEQRLFRLRRGGASWSSIAATDAATSINLRQRLSRALRRAACELGLDVTDD